MDVIRLRSKPTQERFSFGTATLCTPGGTILEPETQPTLLSLVCHYAAIPDDVTTGSAGWIRKRHGAAHTLQKRLSTKAHCFGSRPYRLRTFRFQPLGASAIGSALSAA